MASYTIEDIELIRRKSGISYQEAVALLDYHNGNVARALVDLERNGRIKPETTASGAGNANTSGSSNAQSSKKGLMNLMSRLYKFRLKVKKDSTTILNLSLLFSLLALIISPHLVIIGAILMLILGYHVSFDKNDADFASDNLERMVRNASENVKETVGDFTRGFEEAFADKQAQQQTTQAPAPQAQEIPAQPVSQAADNSRSYYTSNPAAMTQHPAYDPATAVPTIQVPVQVESSDGNVQLGMDRDGYNSATIE